MTSKHTGISPSPAGSTLAAFCQGVILGGLIQGIKVENGAFAGGAFDWATPFALLCGLGVVAGYALLGATWLVMKTEGAVADRARAAGEAAAARRARLHGDRQPVDAARVPAHRRALVLAAEYLLPLAGAAGDRARPRSSAGAGSNGARRAAVPRGDRALPARLSRAWRSRCFPYLVPPSLTIWDTAAAPTSQMFMLIGTLPLLPIILGYVVFVYWLFRGKVREGESYH